MYERLGRWVRRGRYCGALHATACWCLFLVVGVMVGVGLVSFSKPSHTYELVGPDLVGRVPVGRDAVRAHHHGVQPLVG